MTDLPTVHIIADGDEPRNRIVYANGRFEESSLLGEAHYHDIIRASLKVDGSLEFEGVALPSGLHTEEWLLSKALIESAEFRSVLNWVTSVGGNWEQASGGLLLLHVPPHLADTARDRINFLIPQSTG